jgi:hypothetical protein
MEKYPSIENPSEKENLIKKEDLIIDPKTGLVIPKKLAEEERKKKIETGREQD